MSTHFRAKLQAILIVEVVVAPSVPSMGPGWPGRGLLLQLCC